MATLEQVENEIENALEDEPTSHDRMGFERFANSIATIIIKSLDPERKRNTKGIRIGIYGDWGSGKTSFLKMIERALREKEIYPIWFQAWQYRHQEEELWSALTQKILDDARVAGPWYRRIWVKLRIWSNNTINWHDGLLEILRKVWQPVLLFFLAIAGGLLISFSRNTALIISPGYQGASGFSSIPYLSTLIRVLGGVLVAIGLVKPVNDFVKALRGNLGIDFEKFKQKPAYRQKVAFWDQFRKEFETIIRLSGQGKPLVVMIDDLDRCLPEDALQVLEAVKNLLDVSGCIFLLGLDRKIVEKVIAAKYKDMFENLTSKEGIEENALPVKRLFYEDYVDKIFQLAITLPKLSTPDSVNEFIERVTDDKDVRNCIEVFSIGLSPNPRRIKRILRTFLFIRDVAVAEEKAKKATLAEEKTAEEKTAIGWFLLAKFIVMQSEFPDVFDAITENPYLLVELEEYYRKLYDDTTRHPGEVTDSTDRAGKEAGAGGDDISITGSVDLEEARTTKVGTVINSTTVISAEANTPSVRTDHADTTGTAETETNGAAGNNAKAETGVSKKDTTFGGRAEKYAKNYPKLPKILIEGGRKKEAYFSEVHIHDIKVYIYLIGASVEPRQDRSLAISLSNQLSGASLLPADALNAGTDELRAQVMQTELAAAIEQAQYQELQIEGDANNAAASSVAQAAQHKMLTNSKIFQGFDDVISG